MGIGTACFPRDIRLTSPAQFQQVFKKSRIRSADAVFTVLATDNELTRARLGLAVSRKSARLAVVRNRVKRLIREGFRAQKEDLSGLDIVIITRPGIAHKSKKELRQLLDLHWNELKSKCKKS